MIVEATFIDRPNRFVARVRAGDGSEHLVRVIGANGRAAGSRWVSVDTSLPGQLLRGAFTRGSMPGFQAYTQVKPEHTYRTSRLDFLLTGSDLPPCLVEVKSVTSILPNSDGTIVARFPDAPTQRGTRHLQELVYALTEGFRAAVFFLIQRDDAVAFGPWEAVDPQFAAALRAAVEAGVDMYPWSLHVTPEKTSIKGPIPLLL